MLCPRRDRDVPIRLGNKPMNKRVGRNDPCPCGSGKKYKKCCFSKNAESTKKEFKTIYRFEAGSYGDVGRFMPSLACLKLTRKEKWTYHFVLVKPGSIYSEEDQATAEAENDMSEAYKVKDIGGTDAKLAMELRQKGYLSVDKFNVVGNGKSQA